MKILAIETSCDETSVAVVENGTKVRSLVVNSQIDIHKVFGGVVPEIAARSHIEVMLPVIQQALDEAFGQEKRHVLNERLANDNELANGNDPIELHGKSPIANASHIVQRKLLMSPQWDQIDAIAVTQGPGLLGSLLIGTLTARTLAWSLGKPLYPVHHILGHIYANWVSEEQIYDEPLANSDAIVSSNDPMDSHGKSPITNASHMANRQSLIFPKTAPEFPVLALIVSGGHTQLMLATSHNDWKVIGRTRDDAVGEAFDKVAKVLGLPYPGGPSVSKAAVNGDPKKYDLPMPQVNSIDPVLQELRGKWQDARDKADKSNILNPKTLNLSPTTSYDFSFSGLKTAVLRAVQRECGKSHDFPSFELAALLSESQKNDFAASFQAKAIEYLVSKTKKAFDEFQPKSVIIGGGVAASLPFRDALSEKIPIEINYAPQVLCTDNAAMIGARAYFQAQSEEPTDPRQLETKPSWPL